MIEAIIVILVVLWLLGFTIHLGGAFIHILLVLAVIAVLFRIIRGRPAL